MPLDGPAVVFTALSADALALRHRLDAEIDELDARDTRDDAAISCGGASVL
jgi:hypothetical protein